MFSVVYMYRLFLFFAFIFLFFFLLTIYGHIFFCCLDFFSFDNVIKCTRVLTWFNQLCLYQLMRENIFTIIENKENKIEISKHYND